MRDRLNEIERLIVCEGKRVMVLQTKSTHCKIGVLILNLLPPLFSLWGLSLHRLLVAIPLAISLSSFSISVKKSQCWPLSWILFIMDYVGERYERKGGILLKIYFYISLWSQYVYPPSSCLIVPGWKSSIKFPPLAVVVVVISQSASASQLNSCAL